MAGVSGLPAAVSAGRAVADPSPAAAGRPAARPLVAGPFAVGPAAACAIAAPVTVPVTIPWDDPGGGAPAAIGPDGGTELRGVSPATARAIAPASVPAWFLEPGSLATPSRLANVPSAASRAAPALSGAPRPAGGAAGVVCTVIAMDACGASPAASAHQLGQLVETGAHAEPTRVPRLVQSGRIDPLAKPPGWRRRQHRLAGRSRNAPSQGV
jgi:hypothetical protein